MRKQRSTTSLFLLGIFYSDSFNHVGVSRSPAAGPADCTLGTRAFYFFESGFEVQDEFLWYSGTVQGYNAAEDAYDVLFDDGDRNRCFAAEDLIAVRERRPP